MTRSSAPARTAAVNVISLVDARSRFGKSPDEACKNVGMRPVDPAPCKTSGRAPKSNEINRASKTGFRTDYTSLRDTSRQSCTPVSDDELDAIIDATSVRGLRQLFPHEHSSHTAMLDRAKQERAAVHDDLRPFKSFLRHLRLAPTSSHTLDRTNNADKEYAPGKVRWATKAEQAQNRSTSITLPYNGEDLPLPVVAELTGQKPDTLRGRLDAGWRKEDVVAGKRRDNAPLTDAGWPSGAQASYWDAPCKGWVAYFKGKQPHATRPVFYCWIRANWMKGADRYLTERYPEYFSVEASPDDVGPLPQELLDDTTYQQYQLIRAAYSEALARVAQNPDQRAFLGYLVKHHRRACEPKQGRDAMLSRF